MKTIWIFILASLLLSPVLVLAQRDSLLISGRLKSTDGQDFEKFRITYIDHFGKRQSYVGNAHSGNFEIRLPKQELVIDAVLQTVGAERKAGTMQSPLNLFIHEEDIKIDGLVNELELARVSGGKENDEYNTLRQSIAGINRQVSTLYAPLLKGEVNSESESGAVVMQEIRRLNRLGYDAQKNFIIAHPKSYVSLFLLYRLKNIYTSDDYASTFASIDNQYHNTRIGKEIRNNIQHEIVTAKGTLAPSFARTTDKGEAFQLEDLRGKVFLIDFWGSWCAPCRASMPHLLELYHKYKDKGFEVVGVAQEHGKTMEQATLSWKKAIDELGIHWINVLNNENKEEFDIVKSYNITGFPTKILVDAQGKILLRITASATDDIDVALQNIYGY
ncbi:TlpA family protein disulfide reductase [Sphingobacterium luzhongxinii]|uniref:TlpA family protein disulfide reductase n=1 Tax=Sphingobacterium luzhongxinii TaxID=2654181 RepID=UPI0013DB6532|nr:TlpA disulfide reductase family protein [Sphingobacterium sp. xlx-73]